MRKRNTSLVWRFFDRIENDDRCLAVLCKLCDTQYKFFGNTTNLRSHLIHKHPLQWELANSGDLQDASFEVVDEESNQSVASTKKRKYARSYRDKNMDVLDTSEIENYQTETDEGTFKLVRQLHNSRGSEEEWLEEDQYVQPTETYDQKPKRQYRKIKREVQSPPLDQPQKLSSYSSRKIKSDTPAPIVIDQTHLRDEYSVFGEYVANKLRKFKAPRTRGNLQQLITTILWQAEYGTYDNAIAVKKVLMSTIQDSEQQEQVTHSQSQEIRQNSENDEQNQNQCDEGETIEI